MTLPILEIVIKKNYNDAESALEVIDGKQRLYTAINFINNNLVLNGLEKLVMLNGFKFKDMVLSEQRKFARLTVRTICIKSNSNNSAWSSR